MLALENRIAKLEQKTGRGVARQIVVKGGADASDDQVDAFLNDKGLAIDHARDQIVYLKTLFEDRDGSPDPAQAPLSLLSVSEMRG